MHDRRAHYVLLTRCNITPKYDKRRQIHRFVHDRRAHYGLLAWGITVKLWHTQTFSPLCARQACTIYTFGFGQHCPQIWQTQTNSPLYARQACTILSFSGTHHNKKHDKHEQFYHFMHDRRAQYVFLTWGNITPNMTNTDKVTTLCTTDVYNT